MWLRRSINLPECNGKPMSENGLGTRRGQPIAWIPADQPCRLEPGRNSHHRINAADRGPRQPNRV